MDAKLLLHQHRGLPALRVGWNMTQKVRNPLVIVAVVAKPKDNVGAAMEGILTETKMTVYKDNWFDRIAINHLSQSIQATTGIRNEKEGYDSLIEAAAAVSLNFNPIQQQELVLQSLQKAFPKPILSMIRTLLPTSKFTREYFATFTTFFFSWLVGPCEVTLSNYHVDFEKLEKAFSLKIFHVKESEHQGKLEKNVVHIKKCRFLEGTNCVGMCTNLCKMPSQRFIKDSFGIPVSMAKQSKSTALIVPAYETECVEKGDTKVQRSEPME
ncbi:beta-carotene isomerase D27, chloroplastic [Cinnamomum micranthum f. kanehirae]|uniref:Beta-carotene isomerase D27, chloroplastic n=1 Tax=Cinnamomum micranthum f. kanehirae TaxID=337451 RepID=A0A443PDK1_9MAGN|nr:beta-carotene isomerase D27, chloroplastic [Cinnamomum micranthum f. kanehirae]